MCHVPRLIASLCVAQGFAPSGKPQNKLGSVSRANVRRRSRHRSCCRGPWLSASWMASDATPGTLGLGADAFWEQLALRHAIAQLVYVLAASGIEAAVVHENLEEIVLFLPATLWETVAVSPALAVSALCSKQVRPPSSASHVAMRARCVGRARHGGKAGLGEGRRGCDRRGGCLRDMRNRDRVSLP